MGIKSLIVLVTLLFANNPEPRIFEIELIPEEGETWICTDEFKQAIRTKVEEKFEEDIIPKLGEKPIGQVTYVKCEE